MLKVSSDGRKAALDLRLVGLPQVTPGKAHAAAARISAIWREHKDDVYLAPDGSPYPVRGSLQIVFCDLGTPREDWNVYAELHDQLVERGLPPDAIRFVHDAKTDADITRLFAACRAGHVAVLVGSTEKAGVGTNVQDRAIALHHLDAPWRPADVAQREGRIIRQGNLNPQVQVLRWVTASSFDGYMWQTLERKARFIHDVTSPALDARDVADIGDTVLTFSEAKALAAGNPLLIDKAEADAELTRLQRAERAHHRNIDALRHAIKRHEQNITSLTGLADQIDAAIARRQDTRGEAFAMTVDGTRHTKRADAGQHLTKLLAGEAAALRAQPRRTIQPAQLGGFPLTACISRPIEEVTIELELTGAAGASITLFAFELAETDPAGLITRLENRLHQLDNRKATTLGDIDRARREIEHATADLTKPFPHHAELSAARERARQIDEELARIADRAINHNETEPQTPVTQETSAGHEPTIAAPENQSLTSRARPPGPTHSPAASAVETGQQRHRWHPAPDSHAKQLSYEADLEAGH